MRSFLYYTLFIFLLGSILLGVNLLLAPHTPYKEKKTPFECGYHSFNQTRFPIEIKPLIFALMFVIFDVELVSAFPYVVSSAGNERFGFVIIMVFIGILCIGFVFELGKGALTIESRQNKDSLTNTNSTNKFLYDQIPRVFPLDLNIYTVCIFISWCSYTVCIFISWCSNLKEKIQFFLYMHHGNVSVVASILMRLPCIYYTMKDAHSTFLFWNTLDDLIVNYNVAMNPLQDSTSQEVSEPGTSATADSSSNTGPPGRPPQQDTDPVNTRRTDWGRRDGSARYPYVHPTSCSDDPAYHRTFADRYGLKAGWHVAESGHYSFKMKDTAYSGRRILDWIDVVRDGNEGRHIANAFRDLYAHQHRNLHWYNVKNDFIWERIAEMRMRRDNGTNLASYASHDKIIALNPRFFNRIERHR